MTTQQKFRSDAHIMARRETEFKQAQMLAGINGDRNLQHKAVWEAKTIIAMEKRMVRSRMADLKSREASNLEGRKKKLAALLAAEEQQYASEFQQNLETPEQVREKMLERMEYLRDKREAERKAEVDRRMDQRFKSTTDELRKEDGVFYTHGTQIEREKQLIDKRRKLQAQMDEEQVYAQLWNLDAQKKHEREQQEAQQKRANIADMMAVRNWQRDTREVQRQKDSELTKGEREMLKSQWDAEHQAQNNMENQRFVLNRQRNQDLIRHNEAERQLRCEAAQQEKDRDKDMLSTALTREQAIKDLEEKERLARREEVCTLQKFYQEQKFDKQGYEKMIEGLVAQESEKQWGAREQQWRREDQARINLLKNVYQNREADIELKKKLKDEALWLKNHEKGIIDSEVDRQNQAFDAKTMSVTADKKAHQTDILRQVGERDRQIRRDLQAKMFDERAAKLAEVDYQKRIANEKQTNQEMLQTWKNTVQGH